MPSTMASTTRCLPSLPEVFRHLAGLCLACYLTALAHAGDATEVKSATVVASPQGYQLDAELQLVPNPTLVDALERGIHLHFLLELDISRPRGWWWFDEDVASPTRKLHLYYHLLLRRYVVETGYTTRTVASLAEALGLLGRVDDWQILEHGALKPGQRYDARLRLRLDTTQLPKTLSIGAVTSDKWALATPWHTWSFEAPSLPSLP